jgi:hypothetical protein
MIGVSTALAPYRVAIAELPLRARAVDAADGAIAVIDGTRGWGRSGLTGAAAVVVADPAPGSPTAFPPGIPVIVDRERLRPDATLGDAAVDAALFTVECSAAAVALPEAVRDAVGWLRVLSGGELSVDEVRAGRHGIIALLRTDARSPAGARAATLVATVLADASAAPRLRALAIGPERTEVVVDGSGATSVVVTSASGARHLPVRYESRRRVALRRAIEAVGGAETGDLADLRHDEAVAALLLEAINSADSSHRQNRLPG